MPPYTTEATSPERRGFILLLGATNAVLLVLDVARGASQLGLLLAGRLLLMAVLLVSPFLLGRTGPRGARALVMTGGVLTAIGFAGVAHATGGSAGPYLAVVPILPMVYLIAVPDEPWAALAMGLTGGALAVSIVWAEAGSVARLVTTAVLDVFGTVYAVAGAVLHRRVRLREAAARAELAQSEARRVQAERMTLLGRVMAGLAHAVNNPLSAVAAALRWLERAAREPGADPAEVAEVARDARDALERLRRIVLDVGALARQGDGPSEVLDLAELVAHAARLAALRGVRVDAGALGAGLAVEGERVPLVQALAGVLVTSGEGAARRGAVLRLSAEREGDRVSLRIEGAGRGALLHDDLLLVVARERLASLGGGVAAERDDGERLVVRLRAASARAAPPESNGPR